MRDGGGMTNESRARLEADYRRRKAEIRQDPALSWETKERRIKALGEERNARLKELGRGAA